MAERDTIIRDILESLSQITKKRAEISIVPEDEFAFDLEGATNAEKKAAAKQINKLFEGADPHRCVFNPTDEWLVIQIDPQWQGMMPFDLAMLNKTLEKFTVGQNTMVGIGELRDGEIDAQSLSGPVPFDSLAVDGMDGEQAVKHIIQEQIDPSARDLKIRRIGPYIVITPFNSNLQDKALEVLKGAGIDDAHVGSNPREHELWINEKDIAKMLNVTFSGKVTPLEPEAGSLEKQVMDKVKLMLGRKSGSTVKTAREDRGFIVVGTILPHVSRDGIGVKDAKANRTVSRGTDPSGGVFYIAKKVVEELLEATPPKPKEPPKPKKQYIPTRREGTERLVERKTPEGRLQHYISMLVSADVKVVGIDKRGNATIACSPEAKAELVEKTGFKEDDLKKNFARARYTIDASNQTLQEIIGRDKDKGMSR